jgi:hypothetical protein
LREREQVAHRFIREFVDALRAGLKICIEYRLDE